MRTISKLALIGLLTFSTMAFAMNVGDYFQQAITVTNWHDNDILITDPVSQTLQNYALEPDYQVTLSYASDQYTKAEGQDYSHTVTIKSAADLSTICTVTSHLHVSKDGTSQTKPTASNDKCETSTFIKYDTNGPLYGFKVIVN